MGSSEDTQRLRVVMFSAMSQEITAFKHQLKSAPDAHLLDIVFVSAQLDRDTATLASGARAVSLFATDHADSQMLTNLRRLGVELIALRYAGVSSVDLEKAAQVGILVAKTPSHAHTAIAEYTIALILCLNRKVHVGSNKVRDGNLNLHGLMGIDVASSTVGILGTGKVGRHVARILKGFGCKILAYDMIESQEIIDLGVKYVNMNTILSLSDILTLHAPLLPATHHMINADTLSRCKSGVRIINTSRGGLLDIRAAIGALRSGQMGGLAMDVYEGEANLFFKDRTGEQVDEDFQLLRSMPNVLITGHQSTLTQNAVDEVARTTVRTLLQFRAGKELEYEVRLGHLRS